MSECLRKQLLQQLFQQLVISCGGHSFSSFVQHDFIVGVTLYIPLLYGEYEEFKEAMEFAIQNSPPFGHAGIQLYYIFK
jgi:hypothetical protein